MPRKLAPEWRRWLIESLLLGARPRAVERVLVQSGLTASAARQAIDAVVGDPCFRGAFRATSMQRKLEGLLDAYGDLHRQGPAPEEVERRDALGADELLQRYLLRSRPVIARGVLAPLASAALGPPAPQLWLAGLRSSPLRRAATDLLLYQVLGRRELTLVPWCDFLSVAGRARGATPRPRRPLRLGVALSAGESLLIPAGWWYRRQAGATGAAVCYRAGEAAGRKVPATALPRARP